MMTKPGHPSVPKTAGSLHVINSRPPGAHCHPKLTTNDVNHS
jgi:hypothetical protein